MHVEVDKIMRYAFPLIVLIIVAFYYFVNPTLEAFPIRCVWHELTGTQCPSCGLQRAMYALTHARFMEALSYNYFFVVSIPYALLAVLVSWYNFNNVFDRLKFFVYHSYTLKAYATLFFLWWVVRNILGM